jgi:hypothetical protein
LQQLKRDDLGRDGRGNGKQVGCTGDESKKTHGLIFLILHVSTTAFCCALFPRAVQFRQAKEDRVCNNVAPGWQSGRRPNAEYIGVPTGISNAPIGERGRIAQAIFQKESIMTTIAKLAIACTVAVLPLTANAVSSDAAYCSTLSKIYQKTAPKHATPTATVPVAMAQCQSGSGDRGIAALELALKNQGMVLPSR